ncbi:hypothetical protein HanPI659440_Chr15g0609341 [Helianthus annuus]|nr:hypothetical protein HanPI659440_Chr15g0609341 [Helianthus annuus]
MISCDGRRGGRPHDSGGGDFVQQGTPPPFLDVCNRPTTTNVGWWCDGERKRESSGERERERGGKRESERKDGGVERHRRSWRQHWQRRR